MGPGPTRLTLNSNSPAVAWAAPTRWKDIRPPLPQERESASVSSTGGANAGGGAPGAAHPDPPPHPPDKATQRAAAVDRRRTVDDGQRPVADLDVGLLPRHL